MDNRAAGVDRRRLLALLGGMLAMPVPSARAEEPLTPPDEGVTLALCGDVMLGRGVDQILPFPGDPTLHEEAVRSAVGYVALAEAASGPIPRHVPFDYVWGDALEPLRRRAALRLVNLETSVTASRAFAPKGINYKMNPRNVGCLGAAGIDCCLLANNHVLDWGPAGLAETLDTLDRAGIRRAGAGRDADEAERPVALALPGGGRVIVAACGAGSSGIPGDWAAGPGRPGVHRIGDLSEATALRLGEPVRALRQAGDIALVSIHWGPNWGYDIPRAFRDFAHALIDRAGFDLVFGHSAHHAKAIEVHRGRLILYGAGDFIDDYEGIGGYETFRADLAALYLPRLGRATGALETLAIEPFRIRRFRLERPSEADRRWLAETLDRESGRFGTRLEIQPEGGLAARW